MAVAAAGVGAAFVLVVLVAAVYSYRQRRARRARRRKIRDALSGGEIVDHSKEQPDSTAGKINEEFICLKYLWPL